MNDITRSNVNTITIAGRVLPPGVKILYSHASSINQFHTLVDGNDVDYQVPAGKELHILAARFNNRTTTIGNGAALGYANVGTSLTTTPPAGTFGFGSLGEPPFFYSLAYETVEVALNYVVPAEKYPLMLGIVPSNVTVFCIEV